MRRWKFYSLATGVLLGCRPSIPVMERPERPPKSAPQHTVAAKPLERKLPSCSSTGREPRLELPRERDDRSECSISGAPKPLRMNIYQFETGKVPLAVFDGMPTNNVIWSHFDNATGRAHIRITGERSISINGYADLRQRTLFLTARAWIAEPHVFATRGGNVRIQKIDGRWATVAVQAPFEDPLTSKIRCGSLLDGPNADQVAEAEHGHGVTTGGTLAGVQGKQLTLYSTPPGQAVATLRFSYDLHYVHLLESRGGFDRISFRYPGIKADAWVRKGVAQRLSRVARSPPWPATPPPRVRFAVDDDRTPWRVPVSTLVSIGAQPGTATAVLQGGAVVSIVEESADHAAVRLFRGGATTPVWIPKSKLQRCAPPVPQ
jgi:hypothetical protein